MGRSKSVELHTAVVGLLIGVPAMAAVAITCGVVGLGARWAVAASRLGGSVLKKGQ